MIFFAIILYILHYFQITCIVCTDKIKLKSKLKVKIFSSLENSVIESSKRGLESRNAVISRSRFVSYTNSNGLRSSFCQAAGPRAES